MCLFVEIWLNYDDYPQTRISESITLIIATNRIAIVGSCSELFR